ncbi:MAG: carboxypeptidase-like regulatory domain-containing protein, partial [Vicinamibacterales bacterium]|nr:carboxypeptidase-like regulatory domain-containing protein [Vicinamibacterales bacterium]
MTKRFRTWCLSGSAVLLAIGAVAMHHTVGAAADDITGVVTSAGGAEAGVWVIAETSDFDASFRKIVVTDDEGRFLVPDLPAASYEVWVRGYGLVDSDKAAAEPGDNLGLQVTAAATPRDAAQIYPANYWYSLLEVPPASDFPGTGPRGNGIGTAMKTQADWIDRLKDGCQLCHQLGNYATREMPMLNLETFDSTADAWNYRLQAGGAGPAMAAEINRIGRPRAIKLYAEWTDRIRAGAVPPAPPRPEGVERNVVLSMWGWGHPQGMVHDNVSTDKRNPTLFSGGPIYGVGGAGLVVTDIQSRRSVRMDLPTRVERPRRANSYQGSSTAVPSFYYGNESAGLVSRSAHNPMMDDKGRVWITQSVRPNDVPSWCLEGSDHPFAQYYPIQHRAESRQLSYY